MNETSEIKTEMLQEGWVKFQRLHCKDGFIDRWMGDCIDNPNAENKQQLNLNTMATYYRLNGKGEWVHREKFSRDMVSDIFTCFGDYSANEIWNTNKR